MRNRRCPSSEEILHTHHNACADRQAIDQSYCTMPTIRRTIQKVTNLSINISMQKCIRRSSLLPVCVSPPLPDRFSIGIRRTHCSGASFRETVQGKIMRLLAHPGQGANTNRSFPIFVFESTTTTTVVYEVEQALARRVLVRHQPNKQQRTEQHPPSVIVKLSPLPASHSRTEGNRRSRVQSHVRSHTRKYEEYGGFTTGVGRQQIHRSTMLLVRHSWGDYMITSS